MEKEITLIIMAAGMGKRFGGLKQLEPVGPNSQYIIDYSIYDAIEAGFSKIVLIIKKENYEIFQETIGKRIGSKVRLEYVFQELDNIPEEYQDYKKREKPLGTAHAILCCKEKVNTPFLIINADDYYGRDAYLKAAEYLKNMEETSKDYAMVAYHVKNTITERGAVKRGICKTENGYLKDIIESSVEQKEGKIIATPLNGDPSFEIVENQIVSMNMLLFNPTLYPFLEEKLQEFLEIHQKNIEEKEFLIPDVLQKLLKEKKATAKIIETSATWYGMTYKEDKEEVENALRKLTDENIYKENLWSD